MENQKVIKVFLVDDDELFSNTLKKYLKDECFPVPEISTFATGEKCIERMIEKPDVVILDYFLNAKEIEAMNGLGVLKVLTSAYPALPVIMLSSQDNVELAVEMINNGAYDYVTKSESAFIRIKNLVDKISAGIFLRNELDRKVMFYKIVNLIVIILIVFLFIISRYI